MQVGGVSLDLTLIMHEQAFGDYLTDHSFLSLGSVGWRTGYYKVGTHASFYFRLIMSQTIKLTKRVTHTIK